MPYLPDLNTYLHHSSLLLQAYPDSRISTKYSLPRKPNPRSKKSTSNPPSSNAPTTTTTATAPSSQREKRELTATLTLKTYHDTSGICLKYRTDKAAEVGRLMTGLGRLARGEVVDLPAPATTTTAGQGETVGTGLTTVTAEEEEAGKMDVDGDDAETVPVKDGKLDVVAAQGGARPGGPAAGGTGGGGGKGKKKKGKR